MCVCVHCLFVQPIQIGFMVAYMVLDTICKYDACQLNKNIHIKNLWFKHNLASSTSFVAMAEESQDPGREDHDSLSPLVTISQLQQIEFATTGKSWIIPNTLPKDDENGQFLQIQAANYGLCNLLVCGKVAKSPTLKQPPALVSLIQMRTAMMDSSGAGSSEQIFESEASQKKKPKRKIASETECLELDLGAYGTLIVKSAKKSTFDLHIAFTIENVSTFLKYMYEMGAQSSTTERRNYQSTGKYAKSG